MRRVESGWDSEVIVVMCRGERHMSLRKVFCGGSMIVVITRCGEGGTSPRALDEGDPLGSIEVVLTRQSRGVHKRGRRTGHM